MADDTTIPDPLPVDTAKLIILEDGLKAAWALDALRISMLNRSVDWICEVTGMPTLDVRKEISEGMGRQTGEFLATIKAARAFLQGERTK